MRKSVKKNFQKFGLSNKVCTARIRLIRPGKPAPNVCKNACHEKTMIQFPKVNAKGAFTCQIPIILKASSFCVSIRCWKKYPSVAAPGGPDVNPGVTQNRSNSAPAQQHGVCRILTSCSRELTHRLRHNAINQALAPVRSCPQLCFRQSMTRAYGRGSLRRLGMAMRYALWMIWEFSPRKSISRHSITSI